MRARNAAVSGETLLDESFSPDGLAGEWSFAGNAAVGPEGGLLLTGATGVNVQAQLFRTLDADRYTVEFRVRVEQYTSGSANLSFKLALGGRRLMFKINEDQLRYCTPEGTWAGSSAFAAGTDWHTYRFKVDRTGETPSAKLYVDDRQITEIAFQEDGNEPVLEFWVNGRRTARRSRAWSTCG